MRAPDTGPLDRLWIAEAIRLTEEREGLFEDDEACRQARRRGGSPAERVLHRAEVIGRREGLHEVLRAWRSSAVLAAWLLAGLATFTGIGLAVGALGDGSRPVNLFWALGGLLGLHLVMLLAWLASLWLGSGGGIEAGGALGRLWWWAARRLGPHGAETRTRRLAAALGSLLGSTGLARWGLGTVVHGAWSVALLAALATLLVQMSLRRYGFVWETTLLAPDRFVAAVQALGWLPGWLGFPLPDAQAVRASGDTALADAGVRQQWAGWLIGLLVVYGVVPRLLLAAWCAWRWRRGVATLTPDLAQPGYALLRERLQPTHESAGVLDPAPPDLPAPAGAAAALSGHGAVLAAIELDPDLPWPPPLPPGVQHAGVVDEGAQRRALLDQLAAHPPRRLLVACDPRRSLDRGTLALLEALAGHAQEMQVWLLAAPDGSIDATRLADWQAALGARGLRHGDASLLRWLAGDAGGYQGAPEHTDPLATGDAAGAAEAAPPSPAGRGALGG